MFKVIAIKFPILLTALLATSWLVFPKPASAWGGLGHRTVAAIAMELLPPDKAAHLNQILAQLEIDKDFVDAASYPDEYIRNHYPQFGDWHFADLPDDGSTFDCKNNCLFTALPQNLAKLKQGPDDHTKAVAIAWVIHLVGDLHQPLHMDARLRGGNEFNVTYRGGKTCKNSFAKTPTKVELHSAWDVCLVEELAVIRRGIRTPLAG